MMTSVSETATLDRPLYGFGQVDDLLDLAGGTARRWIDGYCRGAHFYPPVVRPEATGAEAVTWGEFIETSLLAEYRDVGVPLQRLRPVVQLLREQLGVAYPLAHTRPWVNQKDLVLRAQELVGIEADLRFIYAPRTGQTVLTERADAFYRRVTWEDEQAAAFTIGDTASVLLSRPACRWPGSGEAPPSARPRRVRLR
jgi:hypothetical protein